MALIFFSSFLILPPPPPSRGEGEVQELGGGGGGRPSPVPCLVRQWGARVSAGSTAPWLREVESRVARRRARSTRVPRLRRGAGPLSCLGSVSGVRAPAGRELNTFGDPEVRGRCGGWRGSAQGFGVPRLFVAVWSQPRTTSGGLISPFIFWCL